MNPFGLLLIGWIIINLECWTLSDDKMEMNCLPFNPKYSVFFSDWIDTEFSILDTWFFKVFLLSLLFVCCHPKFQDLWPWNLIDSICKCPYGYRNFIQQFYFIFLHKNHHRLMMNMMIIYITNKQTNIFFLLVNELTLTWK